MIMIPIGLIFVCLAFIEEGDVKTSTSDIVDDI